MAPMLSAFACSSRVGLAVALLVVASAPIGCGHASGRKAPSSLLQITSEAQDADVWVDGQYIGQVAAVSGRLELAPGVHRVEVRKPGHFPVQRTVRVERQGGQTVVVEAELLEDPR